MLLATLLALALAYLAFRATTRGERGKSAIGQLASLEAPTGPGGAK
jgi:hypothetical protein